MESPSNETLRQLFIDHIAYLELIEKTLTKRYKKLEKSAFTDELAKCLSPISTDQEAHLKRLKLMRELLKGKPLSKPSFKHEENKLQKVTIDQDLLIIKEALGFQNHKLAIYEFLHPISIALALTSVPEMIEQTITDNRNTNTWLRQIIQNIVGPALLKLTD